MRILGIETSCDETAVAIVENGTTIIANVIASSRDLHEKTGGIIPEIAAREQMKCMVPVLEESLHAMNYEVGIRNNENLFSSIDAIAVTVGPGLIGSLLIGVETAKTLAMVTGKPIIPVNHIFAHLYANFIVNQESGIMNYAKTEKLEFPALALVVSGGHTELFLMKGHGNLTWLGGTMDDAAGEAFDKTARMIGLGYRGGVAIAAEAEKCRMYNVKCTITKLPRPMLHDDSLHLSFSGLKTAVAREIKELEEEGHWNDDTRQHIAHEIQEAITDVLVAKTIRAAQQHDVPSIIFGGGVAANQRLKEKMESKLKQLELQSQLYVPEPKLCTDNAVVVASYAFFNQRPVSWQEIQADPGLSVEVT